MEPRTGRDAVSPEQAEPAAGQAEKPLEVPAPGVPVFEASNVSIFYGSFRAVTDVSLAVRQ
ncbi:MAG: hypothetical protein ACM3ML_12565, partial [Micromonosporaceae bacterium]